MCYYDALLSCFNILLGMKMSYEIDKPQIIMAVDLNEVKINVRSLLTSSQKPLSISQLQRDYCDQEGCNLPYRGLGFNSVIELLQNMTDVVTVIIFYTHREN